MGSGSDVGGKMRKATMYVNIVEQPAPKGLRFRYECEGRSAGCIPGVDSSSEAKTFPTIEVVGYQGRAVVVVSCVTVDTPYRPHPHSLVGKEGCKKGVCTLEMDPETMSITFSSLGIQCVKRKEIDSALQLRQQIRVDPFQTGFSHKDNPQSIDLNAVRLCFQVFLEGSEKGAFTYALRPVVSNPIYDKKSQSDLSICRMTECSASVAGGKEIMLFCEKVSKDDIQVQFYEESQNGNVIWRALGDFQPTDVHKQYGICLRTPKYHNMEVTESVKAFIQLQRPSDGATSMPRAFYFLPVEYQPGNYHHNQNRSKRLKTDINDILFNTSSERRKLATSKTSSLSIGMACQQVSPIPGGLDGGHEPFQRVPSSLSQHQQQIYPIVPVPGTSVQMPAPPPTQPYQHLQQQQQQQQVLLLQQQQQQQMVQQQSDQKQDGQMKPKDQRLQELLEQEQQFMQQQQQQDHQLLQQQQQDQQRQMQQQLFPVLPKTTTSDLLLNDGSMPAGPPVTLTTPQGMARPLRTPVDGLINGQASVADRIGQIKQEDASLTSEHCQGINGDEIRDETKQQELPVDDEMVDLLYDDVMQCVYDDVQEANEEEEEEAVAKAALIIGSILDKDEDGPEEDRPPTPPERASRPPPPERPLPDKPSGPQGANNRQTSIRLKFGYHKKDKKPEATPPPPSSNGSTRARSTGRTFLRKLFRRSKSMSAAEVDHDRIPSPGEDDDRQQEDDHDDHQPAVPPHGGGDLANRVEAKVNIEAAKQTGKIRPQSTILLTTATLGQPFNAADDKVKLEAASLDLLDLLETDDLLVASSPGKT